VAEPDETPIDLRKEYFARRQPFFGILIATVAASYLPDILVRGNLGNPTDALAKAGIIAINVPALFTANEAFHKVLTVAGFVIICAYRSTVCGVMTSFGHSVVTARAANAAFGALCRIAYRRLATKPLRCPGRIVQGGRQDEGVHKVVARAGPSACAAPVLR
jgi:hypothetical protein